jgi:hypothetical protein
MGFHRKGDFNWGGVRGAHCAVDKGMKSREEEKRFGRQLTDANPWDGKIYVASQGFLF